MATQFFRCGMRARRLALIAAAGAGVSLAGAAHAQVSTWQNPLDGTRLWSLSDFDTLPVEGTTTTLNFQNFWNNAAINASNDIGAFTSISLITLNNQTASTFTVSQATAANTLTFAGGSQILQMGGGSTSFSHPIILGGSGFTTIGGSGNGLLDMSGAITGGSGAGNTSLVVDYTGKGVVQLSGTNSFTGDVRIDAGNVRLTTAGTSAANRIIMNGGSIGLDTAAATIASPIVLNTNTNVIGTTTTTGTTSEFDGVISGVGGLNVLLGGAASLPLTFTAANTFQGGFAVNSVSSSVSPVTLSGAGAFQNASSVTMNAGQIITLDNTATAAANRLGAGTDINLNRSVFALKGNASTDINEGAGALNTSGMGTVQINASSATGGTTQLSVSSINRVANGTLNVTGLNLGTTGGSGTGQANLFSAAAPTLVNGIIPWAIATNTNASANFTSLATYDGAGLRPLAAGEYVNPTYVNQGQTLGNARVLGVSTAPILAGINANTTVSALVLDTPGASAATTGTSIYGKGTLAVPTGAIVTGLSGGTTQSTNASVLGTSSIDLGGAEGILHTVNSAVVLSDISNTGGHGLTKSGNGALTLAGNASTFTGPITINSGTLNIASDAQLGNAANNIVLAGGTGTSSTNGASGLLNFNPNNQWGGAENAVLATSRSVTLGPGGGTVSSVKPSDLLRLDGVVSGSTALNVTGTVQLTNTSNSYSGGTILASNGVTAVGSMLTITDDAQLGSGDVTFAGGSLKIDGSGNTITSNRNIVVRNAPALSGNGLILNGANLTLNGTLDSSLAGNAALTSPVSFTKFGPGTLTLTGDNGFRGTLSIGPGATTPVGNQSTELTGGEVVLSGGGRLASTSGTYLVSDFGKLTLDNTGTSMSNRLSAAPLTLQGGSFEIRAGASNVEQYLGALTVSTSSSAPSVGSGLDVITLNSVGGGSVQLTNSAYTYTAGQTGVLVRGTNLGNTPGAGNANMFIGNNPGLVTGTSAFGSTSGIPTLTAGVLRGMFFDNTAGGNGTGLATYDTSKGVTLYTGATPLPTTGAATTTSYNLSSDITLAGTTQPGSLVVNATGGSVTINNGGNALGIGAGGAQTLMTVGDSPVNINGAGALSLAANSLIYNNTTLNVNSPVTLNSSSFFTKLGTGTLNFNAPTITAGSTMVVGQGTAVIGSALALPATTSNNMVFVVDPGATLDLSGLSTPAIGTISGFGNILMPSGTLTCIGSGTQVFQGSLSGSGNLVSSIGGGSGTAFAGSSPNWTGSTTIRSTTNSTNPTLIIASNDPYVLGSGTSDVVLDAANSATAANVTLSFANNVTQFGRNITTMGLSGGVTTPNLAFSNNSTTLSGNITLNYPLKVTGSASTTSSSVAFTGVIHDGPSAPTANNTAVTLSGGGSFTFKNQNTYTGDTAIATATDIVGFNQDSVGAPNALMSGPLGKGRLVFNANGSLRPDGGTRTIGNKLSYGGAFTTTVLGVDDLNLTGDVVMGANSVGFSTQGRGTTTLSGAITGTGATFTKSGGSVLNITSNTSTTFTSAIAVTQGTLLLNGAMTNNGMVTVSDHAILGGSGTFAGGLTVNSGGILAPGNSPGILSLHGNALLSSGALFSAELNGPAAGNGAGNYDQFVVSGSVGLTGANLSATLDYRPGSSLSDVYWLIVNNSDNAIAGTFAGLPEGATVSLGTVNAVPYTAQISYTGDFASATINGTGNDVVLYNIVPAPGAAMLLGMGGLLAARRRRN